ncbi:MAG: alpha/beta fold hydrolase [Dongiaceae bacterium]
MPRLALALLPGLLCDAALWRHQLADLADVAEMQVADLTLDDSIDGMAARLLSAMPGRFAVAAMSMGGHVALALQRAAPARVLGLALLGASARSENAADAARRLALAELRTRGRWRGVTQPMLAGLVHPDALADPAIGAAIRAMAERVGAAAFRRQEQALAARPDARPGLAAIACPTLVISGADDRRVPPPLQAEIAAAVPGAERLTLPRCGHVAPLERPAEVSAALRRWLARCAAAAQQSRR